MTATWIDVTQQQPEPWSEVLVCDKWGRIAIARYEGNNIYSQHHNRYEMLFPVYWAALPDLPEGIPVHIPEES